MRIVILKSGLGNQMFQYAFSKNLKDEILYDKSFYKKCNQHNGLELEKVFKIDLSSKNIEYPQVILFKIKIMKLLKKILKKMKKLKIYKIDDTIFSEEIMKDKSEIVIYDGYWQSEKYFKNIEKEIKKEFTFPKLDIKNQNIGIQMKKKESVSIHVRRGDYLENKILGGLITKEYYQKSIEYIEKIISNPKYYIFSDDIEWCKKELKLEGRDVTFINHNKGAESYKDMQLMSLCKHNIIPNSSFSWWGAWLNKNPNKIVIAPKRWFTKESGFRYKDIVPESWIKIDNE